MFVNSEFATLREQSNQSNVQDRSDSFDQALFTQYNNGRGRRARRSSQINYGFSNKSVTPQNNASFSFHHGRAFALGGAVEIRGQATGQIAQIIDTIYASSPLARSAANQALQTGERVQILVGEGGSNSFSTLESRDNIEKVYINLDQTRFTSLEHLVLHEVYGHAFGNYTDAPQPGSIGDNQRFLGAVRGIAPQPYGSFYG